MGRQKKWTDDEIQTVKKMWEAGSPVSMIVVNVAGTTPKSIHILSIRNGWDKGKRVYVGSFWTPELIDKVQKMASEGVSSSYISASIPGTTRNSVIGIMSRRGIVSGAAKKPHSKTNMSASVKRSGQENYTKKASGQISMAKLKISNGHEPSVKRAVNEQGLRDYHRIPDDLPATVLFSVVRAGQCKWIPGEPTYEAMCCGGETGDVLKPYCAFHHRYIYNGLRNTSEAREQRDMRRYNYKKTRGKLTQT